MIKPEHVSTDVYAAIAKREHIGLASGMGIVAAGALAFGVEHFEEIEGKGAIGGAVVLTSLAVRSIHKALQYSFSEGKLHDR